MRETAVVAGVENEEAQEAEAEAGVADGGGEAGVNGGAGGGNVEEVLAR